MFKKISALIMSAILLFSFQFAASAENKTPPYTEINEIRIMPLYEYTTSHNTTLNISNNIADCTTRVTGIPGVTTKIQITMTLQKKTLFWWSKVEEWTATVNAPMGQLDKSIAVKSDTYRVKSEITVYSGSNSEKITAYSAEKTC